MASDKRYIQQGARFSRGRSAQERGRGRRRVGWLGHKQKWQKEFRRPLAASAFEYFEESVVHPRVVRRWGFSDCWGLDDEALAMVPSPCVACIFLYPYSQMEARKRALGVKRGQAYPDVWFMQQQVSNACGAVAIMHSVRWLHAPLASDCLASVEADVQGASVWRFRKRRAFQEAIIHIVRATTWSSGDE